MKEWEWLPAEINNGVLNNRFVVVMSCYNAAGTIKNAILSVLDQDHPDLGLVIRNDCSTDDTAGVIRKIFGVTGEGDFHLKNSFRNVIYIENPKKMFYGGNSYDSVVRFVNNPYTIVGLVDGDDFLLTENAVSIMEQAYLDDPQKWLVWSQHVSRAQAKKNYIGYSKPLPADHIIYASRKYWAVSHFRTSLAGLYHLLDLKGFADPLDPNEFAKVCGDAAFLYPMVEMCGNRRCLFIDKMLYYYNDGIPSNDSQVYKDEIELYRAYFEDMEMYKQLPDGFKF